MKSTFMGLVKKMKASKESLTSCYTSNYTSSDFFEDLFSTFVSANKDKRVEKILIIEDEPVIRFLLKRSLSEYYVYEAGDLKEGYELSQKISPDIIVMDVNLPDGNGADHALKFKNKKNTIILISADHNELEGNYSKFGASGFLAKPFTTDKLLGLLKKVRENT